MTTLSVPIPARTEEFIDRVVKQGIASNKADVVRRALARYEEDLAVEAVLQSMKELNEGKVLRGDIRKLMRELP